MSDSVTRLNAALEGRSMTRGWAIALACGLIGPGAQLAVLAPADLAADPREEKNLYQEKPEVVARLRKLLNKYRKEGRSAP